MRAALAAAAARPVSMDAEPCEARDEADVESSALVSAALAAARARVESLPATAVELVVLRFWHGLPVAEAAAVAGVGEQEAAAAVAEAAVAVREALASVLAPGVSTA
jgi:DNA-directed RNA polymerase specialized sigma24 family protein